MASGHVFRNPDKVQQLPFRDYIREHCPGARDGLSVLDLDMVPLLFGNMVGRPSKADGKFMLTEIKANGAKLNYAQERLLMLMHRLLRQADPDKKFFIGSYLLHWDYDTNKPASLNYKRISDADFQQWITGKLDWPSLFDGDNVRKN